VYLASFGTRNIGSGQMCVYGLLQSGAAPAAPAALKAAVRGRFVVLGWAGGAGAGTYTVESNEGGTEHVVASGLVRPEFSDTADVLGTTTYWVRAVSANGTSGRSAGASVTVVKAPVERMH
jgi:hypothetical protein